MSHASGAGASDSDLYLDGSDGKDYGLKTSYALVEKDNIKHDNREDSSTSVIEVSPSKPSFRFGLCSPISKNCVGREKALDQSPIFHEIKDDWEWAFIRKLKIMGKSELFYLLERKWPLVWAMIRQASLT